MSVSDYCVCADGEQWGPYPDSGALTAQVRLALRTVDRVNIRVLEGKTPGKLVAWVTKGRDGKEAWSGQSWVLSALGVE